MCLFRFILKLKNYTDPTAAAHERDFLVLWWEQMFLPSSTQYLQIEFISCCLFMLLVCVVSRCCRWPCSATDVIQPSNTHEHWRSISKWVFTFISSVMFTHVSQCVCVCVCRTHHVLLLLWAPAVPWSFLSPSIRWQRHTWRSQHCFWTLWRGGSRQMKWLSEAAVNIQIDFSFSLSSIHMNTSVILLWVNVTTHQNIQRSGCSLSHFVPYT